MVLYPGDEEFSWFRPGMAASRLDRFHVSRGLIQYTPPTDKASQL